MDIKRLATVGERYRAHQSAARALHRAIRAAVDDGASIEDIARACRVQVADVATLGTCAGSDGNPQPAGTQRDDPRPPARPELAARSLPTGATHDGIMVTARHAPNRERGRGKRRTAWVDLDQYGAGITDDGRLFRIGMLGDVVSLLRALPEDITRVYVCGPLSAVQAGDGPTSIGRVRSWFYGPTPEGWAVDSHYISRDADTPVGRWRHESGRRVEVHRAASWLGDSDYTPRQAAHVMWWLGEQIRTTFRDDSAIWLSTAATTGRDLMMRALPPSLRAPVLAPEWRELIQATSGQGRTELLDGPSTMPDMTYMDGRLMYAGLVWGMPDGNTRPWTGDAFNALPDDECDRLIRGRGRWRVTYTVPDDWAHVGILPTPTGDRERAWCWPSAPGYTGTTWAEGCEVHTALEHGWTVRIQEGVTWGECKALDKWRDALYSIHASAGQANSGGELDADEMRMARHAVRNMLLMGIGALAQRAHVVERSAPVEHAPGKYETTVTDGVAYWQEPADMSPETLAAQRPEWAATIWGRGRNRLLVAPTGVSGQQVGALTVPRDDVVAFRTDAIYLAGAYHWPDDGRVGRFRAKGQLGRGAVRPTTWAGLYALRDEAEEHMG